MRALIGFTIALLSCLSTPAFAGGIGLMGQGGFRNQTVYFYDSSDNMRQYSLSQALANFGGGLELLIGDRDDRIIGTFKGYYVFESPERDPGTLTSLVEPANVVANWREEPRHIGVIAVGLQVGIIGDPSDKQLVAVADIGSGFLTRDHTEYLQVQVGAGGTIALSREIFLFGQAQYHMRAFKGLTHGASVSVGARYLFD